ncbi:MAG: hypothetical protein AAF718_05500 [Pseudomonadota bacterium]
MKGITTLAAALFAASIAKAEPYCADLTNKGALPERYAKTAPIYSDASSGWVFTKDQLKDRYDMDRSAQTMVQTISKEFARRGVQLAIVVAPPRPIVAGQTRLDAAMGDARYDLKAARASFDELVAGLASTGAIVPNLSDVALVNDAIRGAFYFRRDTHWTTTGSAVSAIALAQAVNTAAPDFFPNDGTFSNADLKPLDLIEEEGSLAKIVREVCGTSLGVETAQAFDLTRASGLLGNAADSRAIALVGSSFSNRYKRDHYRFGEALARAFDADVENYSVSGGGPIGAIEAYVLSGALDRREHALVIWELPYTERFNSSSFLRQLLGAIERQTKPVQSIGVDQGTGATAIKVANGTHLSGIEIVSADPRHQHFRLEVRFDDGSKTKITLRRRRAVPSEMRAQSVFGSLAFFGSRKPVEVVVTPAKASVASEISIY